MSILLLNTTGTLSPVIFEDLGYRSFVHPTVDYPITEEYDIDEINDSLSVQEALANGHIFFKDEFGATITDVNDVNEHDAIKIRGVEIDPVAIGDGKTLVYNSSLNKLVYQTPNTSSLYYDIIDGGTPWGVLELDKIIGGKTWASNETDSVDGGSW